MQCSEHPQVEANRACTLCDVASCDACVRPLRSPGRSEPMLTCPACGGLTRACERVAPPGHEILDLVRRPFSGEGLLTAFALSLPYALAGLFPGGRVGGVLLFVYWGALSSYYFQVVQHVGIGRPGLPFSSDVISRWDVSAAIGRGLACLAAALGPVVVVALFAPIPALLIAALMLGLAVAPASILAVAITQSALNGIWPPTMVQIVARAPGAYLRLVGVFALSSFAWWLGFTLASATLGGIPFVGRLALGVVNTLLAVLHALLVGGFLRRNAAEIGYD